MLRLTTTTTTTAVLAGTRAYATRLDVYDQVRAALTSAYDASTSYTATMPEAAVTSSPLLSSSSSSSSSSSLPVSSLLRTAVDDLGSPFRVAVVGNFNTGKSTLVNALLGCELTPEGSDVTTSAVHHINYGSATSATPESDAPGAPVRVSADLPWLRDHAIEVIDTPGVGAAADGHEALSVSELPHADLLLLVTNTTNTLSGIAEHNLLAALGSHRSVTVVLNRIDQVADQDELDALLASAKRNSQKFLDPDTRFFPVSAKRAKSALDTSGHVVDSDAWEASRMGPLRDMLSDLLASDARKYIKLRAPLQLGIDGLSALQTAIATASARADDLGQPLVDINDSFSLALSLFDRELDTELKRAAPSWAAAGKKAAESLPSAGTAFFTGIPASYAPGSDLTGLLPPLRESLTALTKEVQLELNEASKAVATAIGNAKEFTDGSDPDAVKASAGASSELSTLLRALDRAGPAGNMLPKRVLADALDDLVGKATSHAGLSLAAVNPSARLARARAALLGFQALAAGSAGTAYFYGPALELSSSTSLAAMGGAGLASLLGVGMFSMAYQNIKSSVASAFVDTHASLLPSLSSELHSSVSAAIIPLKEAIVGAKDVLSASRKSLDDSSTTVSKLHGDLELLQSSVEAKV